MEHTKSVCVWILLLSMLSVLVSSSSDALQIYPHYAGMLGGKMIDVKGPYFISTANITCEFGVAGTHELTATKAIYVNQSMVRCMVPRLMVRDRIDLRLSLDGIHYNYSAPITIILPSRMPSSEHVTPVSSTSPDKNWLSSQPTTLTLTWNSKLLSSDPKALVDVLLIGYRETTGKGEYKQLATLGTGILASSSSYTFQTADHRCSGGDCYEIGVLVVTLQDGTSPGFYRYLSSRVLPLGWWLQSAMMTTHGVHWPSKLCVDWYNRDRLDTDWLKHILHCPCSLSQALADFGRWQPDVGCSISNQDPDNCFYHKGAAHCVRAVQPVRGAGNQCCYGKGGDLIFAQDSFQGSTPDRSHDWGAAPYSVPGFIPSLSHWLTDVVTFYYCCIWSEYKSCDYYMDSRPTKDCVGYNPPVAAGVYGQGHVTPFGGPAYNFRILVPGDYILFEAGNTVIQARFEKNMFQTPESGIVPSVYSLTRVAVQDTGTSDKVELSLRGPQSNNLDSQKIDVTVNGEILTFDDGALAWHDLKGVAVINTDRSRRVQSNFTVILTNGIGFQVVEVANTLQMDLMIPEKTFDNISGLLGDLSGTMKTPDGTPVDFKSLKVSDSGLYYRFEKLWSVADRSHSLFNNSVTVNQTLLAPVPVVSITTPSLLVCGSLLECTFDYRYTGSASIALGTIKAIDRMALLRQYLQPVRSCGLLDIPRAIKTSYSYTLGTTTTVEGCRAGSLSGRETYMCAATSNNTQEWTPAPHTTCGNFSQPAFVG